MRYYLPDHPNAPLLKELCDRYKEISAQQQDKREDIMYREAERKFQERKLDQEFAARLKDIDLESEATTNSSDESEDQAKSKS